VLVVEPPLGSSPVVVEPGLPVVVSNPVVVEPVVPAVALVPLLVVPASSSSSIPALSMMPTHAEARSMLLAAKRIFFIVNGFLTKSGEQWP
jgi:hypothetical protein